MNNTEHKEQHNDEESKDIQIIEVPLDYDKVDSYYFGGIFPTEDEDGEYFLASVMRIDFDDDDNLILPAKLIDQCEFDTFEGAKTGIRTWRPHDTRWYQ